MGKEAQPSIAPDIGEADLQSTVPVVVAETQIEDAISSVVNLPVAGSETSNIPQVEPVERMVTYKGQSYPESKLREVCPYLAKLGETAYKIAVNAHIKAEAKAAESKQTQSNRETNNNSKAKKAATPSVNESKTRSAGSEVVKPVIKRSSPFVEPIIPDTRVVKDVIDQAEATTQQRVDAGIVEDRPVVTVAIEDPLSEIVRNQVDQESTATALNDVDPSIREITDETASALVDTSAQDRVNFRLYEYAFKDDLAPELTRTSVFSETRIIALAEAVDEVFGIELAVSGNEELEAFLASDDEGVDDVYSEAEYRELEGFGAEEDIALGEQNEVAIDETQDELDVPLGMKLFEAQDAEPQFAETDVYGAMRAEEIVYDEEVMDTFEELVALINVEQEDTAVAPTQLFEGLVEGQLVGLRDAETDEAVAEVNPFAEFIAAQPLPGEPATIENIVAQANQQPLEETLVQLALCLAETGQEPTQDNQVASRLLREVGDILSQLQSDESIAGQLEQPGLTPEVTQNLLLLLRTIGYDDPKTALLEFVEQHGFDYLMQAARHLYRQTDEYKQQEFLSLKQAFYTSDDEPLTTRLGRIIFKLIRTGPAPAEFAAH